MPIRVLPEDVASQIAAGEVVERPASVVKELIENAIDAGASTVNVSARSGGKKLIRVTDDGCGIPSGEVELAFHRHSTSKLSSADDLECITTLGFRGEALASIAAVSRMTFATQAVGETSGASLVLEGGQTVTRRDIGRTPGTTVTVEDLFFNVPARRKFLRSDRTERRHIDRWVTRYALAYPALRFALNHGDETVFRSPGTGELRDVLAAMYGLEIGEKALEMVSHGQDGQGDVLVSGLVGPPSLHRANRTYITIFVNGRWVNDASLTYAVTQAYHRLLPTKRYPLAVVMVDVPPTDLDVNVHPTKAEVRFRDSDAVFRAVQRAVRRTLLERSPVPETGSWSGEQGEIRRTWPTSDAADDVWRRRERLIGLGATDHHADRQLQLSGDLASRAEGGSLPPLRAIGQLGATYILAEGPGGLYLLDQHAAHERVLFEQLLAERDRAEVISQSLLEPALVDLEPAEADLLEEHLESLSRLGFDIEPFGGSTILVRAMPTIVAAEHAGQVLGDVAAALQAGDEPLTGSVEEAVARQVCKRAAVKAGKVLDHPEIESLIRALEQCDNPRSCPHGRPTMIRLAVEQLAREFGRH